MSSLHVLERSGAGFHVVVHVTIPNTSNAAGLAWSNVIVKSGLGGTTILAAGDGTGTDGGISTVEKAQIVAGTVYEVVDSITPPSDATTPALIAAWLDAYVALKTVEARTLIQTTLNRYGSVRP